MEISGLARIVFQTELENMQLNLAGYLAGLDPIHLHDLRVAERRTRAALSEFKDFLPDDLFQEYREHFRWLHQITNPVRDLDVGISHFPHYRRKISLFHRAALEPALILLQTKRLEAQQQLVETLGSGRVDEILRAWSAQLEGGIGFEIGSGPISAEEFGSGRICQRFHSLLEKALVITPQSIPGDFHRLRIRVKKLRYQIEFYNLAMGQRRIFRLLRRLKRFQDILGGYQDAVVQIEYIHRLKGELAKTDAGLETQAAMEKLTASYQKQILTRRRDSLRHVRWLTSPKTARIFQRSFHCPPPPWEGDLF